MKTTLKPYIALALISCVWANIAQAQSSFEEDSAFHFAGYADIGYGLVQGGGEDVFSAKFAPIIHYQYQDWFLFEAEGEFDFEDAGASEKNAALEYASMNFFVNDNLSIGVGKYLSPVGNFIQNLHPSWINKLPSMPLGFAGGHHGAGATPNNDFGIQARGGFETGEKSRMNYAIMVGNGPELIVEEAEDGDQYIEGLDLPAKFDDANSDKAIGGRLGFLPIPNLEFGISFETADAAFAGTRPADAHEDDGHGDEGDEHAEEGDEHAEEGEEHEEDHFESIADRSYKVFSFDFYFAPTEVKNLILRGEFASTKLGKGHEDEYDHDKKRWEAWYAQASYYFPNQKIETVARYGNFSPAGGDRSKQWSLGLNYIHKSNSIIKAAYELNNGGSGDRALFQYAYGF
jgi:hypothetical protein